MAGRLGSGRGRARLRCIARGSRRGGLHAPGSSAVTARASEHVGRSADGKQGCGLSQYVIMRLLTSLGAKSSMDKPSSSSTCTP